MESATIMAFENFAKFYRENRERFELPQRKKWDEVTGSLTPPDNFYWMQERKDGYDAVTVGWSSRNGRYQYQFPLYEIHYHTWTGKNVLSAIADLPERLVELDPNLPAAITLLIAFNNNLDDMRMWYNVDVNTGKLIYLKASRAKGLLQVKAELKED